MITPDDGKMTDSSRVRRVSAVVLSLAMPGAGHFLLGAFRRGVAWAVGLAILGLLLLFAAPLSLLILNVLISVVGGRVGAAIDAARIVRPRPSWKIVIVAWAALLGGSFVGDRVIGEPLKAYYRTHYAQAFTIPSAAMQPTLLVGDYIMVDKSAYRVRTPQRGDIVVFPYPQDERRDFIKRIVATAGELVQIRGRLVLVNGKPLTEPYTKFADSSVHVGEVFCGYAYGCEPTLVPPDSYFVMGENRDNSQDSRYWGFVKRDKIKGKALLIYWSWDGDRHWLRIDRIGGSL